MEKNAINVMKRNIFVIQTYVMVTFGISDGFVFKLLLLIGECLDLTTKDSERKTFTLLFCF